MKTIKFIFLISILFVDFAKAESLSQDEQLELAKTIPLSLIKEGKTLIGKIDLNRLIKEIDQVKFETFSQGFVAGSGKQRGSAIYIIKTHRVVFNALSLQSELTNEAILPLVFLHESLGAWGVKLHDLLDKDSYFFVDGDILILLKNMALIFNLVLRFK
ncbi:MAG: hypothetical protein HY072_04425 [Deltaproteobacteria bacterium]|nr:hypothetical protein [Deltaproteobacteria bacterium]